METETYISGGINWNWYLQIENPTFGARDCVVVRHWRVHQDDAQPTDIDGNFDLIEDNERTLCAVHLVQRGQVRTLAVRNRQYVFDYK